MKLNTPQHFIRKSRAFTLIELMIAIAISSALMVGVSEIYSNSKRTYKLNNELARVQENIRYTIEEMSRDIRMAGYTGCRNNTLTNTLNQGSNWKYNVGMPLQGFEGGVDTFPSEYSADAIAGTDTIIVLRGGADTGLKFQQNVNSAQFKVNTVDHGLKDNDIIMLTDCTHTAVVQVTNASPGTNNTIVHQTGTGGPPGNCTKGMGSSDCSSVNGVAYNWNKDAHVVKFLATAYYIANSVNGLPGSRSLYRMQVDKGNPVPEELIEGVENMQITYGYDSNNDGFANRYIKANEIPSSDFNRVMSVRIGLLFQSRDNAKKSVDTKTYVLAGTNITAAATPGSHQYAEDNRLRFAINTVVKLRNRGVK